MSHKGRIKVYVAGSHPLLLFLRDRLIRRGFACVAETDTPDFLFVGGLLNWENIPSRFSGKPVLLLSDDSMYSDKDFNFSIREKVPMREDDPIFLASPLEPKVAGTLRYLLAENHFLALNKTMVLRIFNTYGPELDGGIISKYIVNAVNSEPLPMFNPGYQTRTYLHQNDLIILFDRLVDAFLDGTTGIFNVGSKEEISIKRLADTVWQLRNPQTETAVELLGFSPPSYRWWVVPDLTRTQAITKWTPTISLRTGLWELLQKFRG